MHTPTDTTARAAADTSTADRPSTATWKRILLAVAALFALMTFAASPASAEPRPGHDQNAGRSTACATQSSTAGADVSSGVLDYLPVYRWTDSASTHYRLGTTDIAGRLEKGVFQRSFLLVGNLSWGLATSLTQWSLSACFIDSVGGIIDNTAGALAKALFLDSILGVLIIVVGIFFLAFKAVTLGVGLWVKQLGAKALIAAFLVILINGAINSTGGGSETGGDNNYRPGAGSPGWFAVQIDNVLSTLAAGVTASLPQNSYPGAAEPETDVLHCGRYVAALHDLYRDNAGGAVTSVAANIPLMMTSVWESTGLRAWQVTQFGVIQGTDTAPRMYCRVLEYNNGTSRDDIITAFQQVDPDIFSTEYVGGSGEDGTLAAQKSLALWGSGNNDQRDHAYVAWAHCLPAGTFRFYLSQNGDGESAQADVFQTDGPRKKLNRNGYKSGDGDGPGEEIAKNCADTFVGDDYKGNSDHNWDKGSGTIDDHVARGNGEGLTERQATFLLSLHGVGPGNDSSAAGAYALGGIIILLVFGIISCVVLYAKIGALMAIATFIYVVAGCLFANSDSKKIGDAAKRYVGLSALAFFAQLILAIVSMLTTVFVDVGTERIPGGEDGVLGLLWAGFAPALALLTIHALFKKMRVPSPVSIKGGLSWGKALTGGAGITAAAAGLGRWSKRLGGRKSRSGGGGRPGPTPSPSEGPPKERDNEIAPVGSDTSGGGRRKKTGGPSLEKAGAAVAGTATTGGLPPVGSTPGGTDSEGTRKQTWDDLDPVQQAAYADNSGATKRSGRYSAKVAAARDGLRSGIAYTREVPQKIANSKSLSGAKFVAKWGVIAAAASPLLAAAGPLGTAAIVGIGAQQVARNAVRGLATNEERQKAARQRFDEAQRAAAAYNTSEDSSTTTPTPTSTPDNSPTPGEGDDDTGPQPGPKD